MKYYAAITNENEGIAPTLQPPYRLLLSYHYFKTRQDLVKEYLSKGFDLFIDSGAFSAETLGAPIDIDEYCNYIKETGVGVYAGLDVIGDAEKTMQNVKYMEKAHGLTPIPTFHIGGDLKHLYDMLNYQYIALGGLVFSTNVERYLDEVWSIILRESPKMRVHGFGMTNISYMENYPWYSVDSSSYKAGRRFGRVQILWDGFTFKNFTCPEFMEHLRKLCVPVDNLANKEKYLLWDYYSVQSFKQFALHLEDINKTKNFSYLTAQMKMF
jgi:hypothetical protein